MDWKEKQLEDYAVEHWDDVFRCITPDYKSTVLGRQIPCRHGIIDLLAFFNETLLIVEFKAVKADDTVAGQLQRYRRAIEGLFFPDFVLLDMIPVLEERRITQTVVVAPSFTKKALYGVDFCIKAWRTTDGKQEGGYIFEPAAYCGTSRESDDNLRELLTPYYKSVLRTEQARLMERTTTVLRQSAEQRLKETN